MDIHMTTDKLPEATVHDLDTLTNAIVETLKAYKREGMMNLDVAVCALTRVQLKLLGDMLTMGLGQHADAALRIAAEIHEKQKHTAEARKATSELFERLRIRVAPEEMN
jgi:Ni,Fe-hydrogenase maturation factor